MVLEMYHVKEYLSDRSFRHYQIGFVGDVCDTYPMFPGSQKMFEGKSKEEVLTLLDNHEVTFVGSKELSQ